MAKAKAVSMAFENSFRGVVHGIRPGKDVELHMTQISNRTAPKIYKGIYSRDWFNFRHEAKGGDEFRLCIFAPAEQEHGRWD